MTDQDIKQAAKYKIYVSRRIPSAVLEHLQTAGDVQLHDDDNPPSRQQFLENIAEADAVLTMLTEKMDAEAFTVAAQLKVISNYAVGYDNISIAAANWRGIPVGNTPGVLTESTADLAFTLILAGARRIGEGIQYVQKGQWKTWYPLQLPGYDIYGATLGIIGFGRIGQAVARRAKGFGMRIVYHGGSQEGAPELQAEKMALDDVLKVSDFVTLHVPLKNETRHLIGAAQLALMKPTAILVNTARGAVVDSDALVEALKKGTPAGAALDVTDPEPIPADHPLLKLPNCLIVPHIGSATYATRERMGMLAADNIIAGLRGEHLPNCVNPEVYQSADRVGKFS